MSARRTGTALITLGVASVLVRLVTVRWVPRPFSDGGAPRYGFPMPAFGWGGASSGEWNLGLVPLAVDLTTAAVVVAPIVFLISRRLSPRAALVAGLVAAIGAGVVHAESVLKLAIGANHAFLTLRPFAGSEAPCRTLWLGEPRATVDWADPNDACARSEERGDLRSSAR